MILHQLRRSELPWLQLYLHYPLIRKLVAETLVVRNVQSSSHCDCRQFRHTLAVAEGTASQEVRNR